MISCDTGVIAEDVSEVLYQETYDWLDEVFWDSQPTWAKTGFCVVRGAQPPGYPSHGSRAVWRLAVEFIVGYKEKSKLERGNQPLQGMQELWDEIEPARTMAPYKDPRNGAVVLYEEAYYGGPWTRDDPWWTREVGFRIVQCDSGIFQSIAATFPPEILFLILHHAQKLAQNDKTVIARLVLTCRAWSVGRHQFLFNDVPQSRPLPVDRFEAQKYVSLVVRHAAKWRISNFEEGRQPGWIRRCISLYNSARNQILASSSQHHWQEILLNINLGNVLSSHGHYRCRSIFSLCPSSLPKSCTHTLQKLTLSDYRFQCFSDLMHLVWELPSLDNLDFKDVSWEKFEILNTPTLHTQLHNLFTIHASSCPDLAPFILILTSVFELGMEGKGHSGVLGGSDGQSLVALVKPFLKNSADGEYFQRYADCLTVGQKYGTRSLEFKLIPGPTFFVQALCISNLEMWLPWDMAMEYDWIEINTPVSDLVRNVNDVFTIFLTDLHPREDLAEDCVRSATYIISKLPHLRASGRLQFQMVALSSYKKLASIEELIAHQRSLLEQEASTASAPAGIEH